MQAAMIHYPLRTQHQHYLVYSRYTRTKSHHMNMIICDAAAVVFSIWNFATAFEWDWLVRQYAIARIFIWCLRAIWIFWSRFRADYKAQVKWTRSFVRSSVVCTMLYSRKSMNIWQAFTWNMSVSESSLYSTITAWFRDSVYDIECWFASKIAFDVWGDWTI